MEWTAEADAVLLHLLERYRPCGAQRPWALCSLRSALKTALPSMSIAPEEVGRRVRHYYDFDSAVMEDVRHALERQLRTPTGYRLPRRIWAAQNGAEAAPARREALDPESAVSEAVSGEAAGAEAEGTSEEGDDRKRKRSQGASSPTPANKRAAPSKQEAEGARRRQQRAEEIYRSVKVRCAHLPRLPSLCPTLTCAALSATHIHY